MSGIFNSHTDKIGNTKKKNNILAHLKSASKQLPLR